MTNERLSSLALLHIHHDMVNIENIIDEFDKAINDVTVAVKIKPCRIRCDVTKSGSRDP